MIAGMGGEDSIGEAGYYMNAGEYVYTSRLFNYLDQYRDVQTMEDKISVMTKLVNLWHHGGDTNWALISLGGIPDINRVVGASERVFLKKLENFDRPEFWEKEIRPYEKSRYPAEILMLMLRK